jgi:2-dehydro-3-deoxygluconokinase
MAVDVVTFGETMALFQPLQDGPLPYAPLFTRAVAGAKSNLAIALTRLGRKARWISRVGTDPFGDLVVSMIGGEGVDVSLVTRDTSAPTAVFFREKKSYDEPNVFYYRKGSAASLLSPEDVRPEWFEGARQLHVTGITPALGPRTADAVRTAMQQAKEQGLIVSFDPNLRRKLWSETEARETLLSFVPLCDLFMPGLEEAEFLLGEGDQEDYGLAFLQMGPKIVALKLGTEGAAGFAENVSARAPAFPITKIIDPIGAGDAWDAGFLSVLLDESSLPWESQKMEGLLSVALERGNIMGALATQFKGDWEGLPTLAELEQLRTGLKRITR